MPRAPEVFVRSLLDEERAKISQIGSRTQSGTRLRRTMIVQMSSQDRSVPDIVALMGLSEDYIREVIHDFNDHGLNALDPKWSGGSPPPSPRPSAVRYATSRSPAPAMPGCRLRAGRCRSWPSNWSSVASSRRSASSGYARSCASMGSPSSAPRRSKPRLMKSSRPSRPGS